MEDIIGFSNLAVGQRAKIKGKPEHSGQFVALEIAMKAPAEHAEIEAIVQNVNANQKTVRVLNRDITIPDGVVVKDLNRNDVGLQDLRSGQMAKLKGKYTAADGLVVEKIKMKETMGFNVEELQGNIDEIDKDKKTLLVNGFTVIVNEKTMIEGF